MSNRQFDEAVGFLEDFHVNWSNSEAVPIRDSLAQALDALAVTTPTYTVVTSQFDWLGLDPKTLIGNYIAAHSINEHHNAELIFSPHRRISHSVTAPISVPKRITIFRSAKNHH